MTQQEALELVRKTSILEGVFDHHGNCRAPDYGECTCSKEADDNRIVELVIAIDSDARIDELRRMARERCFGCKQQYPMDCGPINDTLSVFTHSILGRNVKCEAQAEHRRIAELEAQG